MHKKTIIEIDQQKEIEEYHRLINNSEYEISTGQNTRQSFYNASPTYHNSIGDRRITPLQAYYSNIEENKRLDERLKERNLPAQSFGKEIDVPLREQPHVITLNRTFNRAPA